MVLSPSLVVGCYCLLGLFLRQLHILSPLPVALLPSLAVGRYSLLGLFLATVTHFEPLASGSVAFAGGWSLEPPGGVFGDSYTLGALCQWPCRLRWRLVAIASWRCFWRQLHILSSAPAALLAAAVGWLLSAGCWRLEAPGLVFGDSYTL